MQALHSATDPAASAVAGGVLVSVRVGGRPVQFVLSAADAERLAAALHAEVDAPDGGEDEWRSPSDIGVRVSAGLGDRGPALDWLE